MAQIASGNAQRIVFATSNAGKFAEFMEIARTTGLSAEIVSFAELGFDCEIEESGATFAENALIKALAAARLLGSVAEGEAYQPIVVAEDSGLVVDALDFFPGVNSKRVAATDPERIAIVLDRLASVGATEAEARTARFVCCAAVADATGVVFEARGEVEGVIAQSPRGTGGFGYDPIFYYQPAGRTFAEMTREEKSRVSHRGNALRQVCEWIAGSSYPPS